MNQIVQENDEQKSSKELLEKENEIYKTTVDEIKKRRDSKVGEVDMNVKHRVTHTKSLKNAEDKDYELDEGLVHQRNKVKKLENQIRGY